MQTDNANRSIEVLTNEPGATRALARAWQECPMALVDAIKKALDLDVTEVIENKAEVDGNEVVGLSVAKGRHRRIDIVTEVRLADNSEVIICWEAKIAAPFDENQVNNGGNGAQKVHMVAITADKKLSQKLSRAGEHHLMEWKVLVAQLGYRAGWCNNEGLTRGLAALIDEMLDNERVKIRYALARGLARFLKGQSNGWQVHVAESTTGGDLAVASRDVGDTGLWIQVEVQLQSHGKDDPQATILVCSTTSGDVEVGKLLKKLGNQINGGGNCSADSPAREQFNQWLDDNEDDNEADGVEEAKGSPGHRAEADLADVPACLRYGYGQPQQDHHGWHGYGARLHPKSQTDDCSIDALFQGARRVADALVC